MIILKFIELDLNDQEMMDKLYPVYQRYEMEISSSTKEEIFPEKLAKENVKYFKAYFGRGIKTYLCIINETITGFVSYHIDSEQVPGYAQGYHGWGHLAEIYLEKEYRSRGIGRQMVKIVEEELKRLNIYQLYLTDLSHNITFWKSLDYIDTGKIEPNEGGKIFLKYL